MWKSLSGHRIEDLAEEVRNLVGEEDRIVHIGTDAKHRGFHTHYVTVVAILDPGHGGRVFYRRHRHPRTKSLAQKLFREAELSLDVANVLNDLLAQEIIVHVDVNLDERHRSSKYVAALSGMVLGHGYRVMVKPDAWCATSVADYVVNERHRRGRERRAA